jgi:hypothetical protein
MSHQEQSLVRVRRSITGPNLEWLVVFVTLTSLLGVLILMQRSGYGGAYLGIVLATGLAYYLIHHRSDLHESQARRFLGDPNLERLGLYLALFIGIGFSLRNGLEGCIRIHGGEQEYWSPLLWRILGPVYVASLMGICGWVLWRPLPASYRGDLFPHATGLIWLVLIVQNCLAQAVTGPATQWNEFVFKVYYLLLFLITAVIVIHTSERSRWISTNCTGP